MADELQSKGPEIVRANVGREVLTPPGLPSYYANDTMVQATPWDVRFMFGMVADVDAASEKILITRVADVRMSLQHAKRVAQILTQLISQYEAKSGTLALPED